MHRTAVISSNVATIAFDPQIGLEVEFRCGSLYRYPTVDAAIWQQLAAEAAAVDSGADGASVGRALHELVKRPGYAYEKVRGIPTAHNEENPTR
jgi:hypothetical protein